MYARETVPHLDRELITIIKINKAYEKINYSSPRINGDGDYGKC